MAQINPSMHFNGNADCIQSVGILFWNVQGQILHLMDGEF
jgi:hypothetical protein